MHSSVQMMCELGEQARVMGATEITEVTESGRSHDKIIDRVRSRLLLTHRTLDCL